uniref:Uncharacterized protein n=1 Tax=Parascaris univalens TaxID=6257 RepID=A0A915CBF5_PARUN
YVITKAVDSSDSLNTDVFSIQTCEMHELQKMRIISPSSRNFSPLRNP